MVSCTMGSSCSVLEYGMSVRSYQDMIGQGHFALKCAHHFYSTTMTTNWASCDWWDDLVIERITEMALLLPHTFVFNIAFGEHYCTCMTPFTWQVTLSENSGPHVEIFATTCTSINCIYSMIRYMAMQTQSLSEHPSIVPSMLATTIPECHARTTGAWGLGSAFVVIYCMTFA